MYVCICVYSTGHVQSDTLHVWGSASISQAATHWHHTPEDKASRNSIGRPRKDLTDR